ncbi:MAG: glycogen synthase, partial [Actinomycetota bacterium]
MPDYGTVKLTRQHSERLEVAEWAGKATARTGVAAGIGEVTLIDVPGIARDHPYLQPDGNGWIDNDRRFFAFSAAVAAVIERTNPNVVHL